MCLICGSPKYESHFGGVSCRACAAFFRRYFNSKKQITPCRCHTKKAGANPCRSCRIAICLAVGMTPEKICSPRDSYGKSGNKSSPRNALLLNTRISPRATIKITSTLPSFSQFEQNRVVRFACSRVPNILEISSLTSHDVFLIEKLVSEVFPDFERLTSHDKRALIENFVTKLWQMEPLLDDVAKRIEYQRKEDMEIQQMLRQFFEGSFMQDAELNENQVWDMFGTSWKFYYDRVIHPLCMKRLDQIELMAIIWILFFDYAYINISENCSNLCWNIRKTILRELKNREMEVYSEDEAAERRFLDILEVPLMVESAEKSFHNEVIMCEVNKVRMHDDFKELIRRQRI